jgi:hypothetical protein
MAEFARQDPSAEKAARLERGMYLKQSDRATSLQLSSQRKRDLLHHYEAYRDELDRWRSSMTRESESACQYGRMSDPDVSRDISRGEN